MCKPIDGRADAGRSYAQLDCQMDFADQISTRRQKSSATCDALRLVIEDQLMKPSRDRSGHPNQTWVRDCMPADQS